MDTYSNIAKTILKSLMYNIWYSDFIMLFLKMMQG